MRWRNGTDRQRSHVGRWDGPRRAHGCGSWQTTRVIGRGTTATGITVTSARGRRGRGEWGIFPARWAAQESGVAAGWAATLSDHG
jgi:hypothetical protein